MKIKGDFITNSSSTSYVVYIPDDFDYKDYIEDIKTDDIWNDYCEEENKDEIDKIWKHIKNIFNELKTSEDSILGENGYMSPGYYIVEHFIKKMGFVVSEVNIGSCQGTVTNVNNPAIKKKIELIRKKIEKIKMGGD
jgi:DNA phosphorothioation-dependent restriction protein DptG